MNRLFLLGCCCAAVSLTGCAGNGAVAEAPVTPAPQAATANLMDASGQMAGTARVEQIGDSLRVTVDGTRLPQGPHGVHLHQVGLCTPPTFESAGGHWNPTDRMHGKDNPAGMHKGDLPNILIGTDGRGSIEYTVPMASLGQLIDGDGAAIVVHAQADDYRTDPSGASGARIACGVLR
ncbi:MAG TPA: superoxide dismutase family protein [Allosphingosinicella sp.]